MRDIIATVRLCSGSGSSSGGHGVRRWKLGFDIQEMEPRFRESDKALRSWTSMITEHTVQLCFGQTDPRGGSLLSKSMK